MLLVTPAHIGTAAWRRLVRDAVLVPVCGDVALPVDATALGGVVLETSLRAMSLTWSLPRRAVVAGLAALWVRGFVPGAVRWRVDVAVPRGCHPDPPGGTTSTQWAWHSDSAACLSAQVLAHVRVANAAHAAVSALRRSDHALAIPAVAGAIRDGACSWDGLRRVVGDHSRRGPGYDRMVSALAALSTTTPGPADARR